MWKNKIMEWKSLLSSTVLMGVVFAVFFLVIMRLMFYVRRAVFTAVAIQGECGGSEATLEGETVRYNVFKNLQGAAEKLGLFTFMFWGTLGATGVLFTWGIISNARKSMSILEILDTVAVKIFIALGTLATAAYFILRSAMSHAFSVNAPYVDIAGRLPTTVYAFPSVYIDMLVKRYYALNMASPKTIEEVEVAIDNTLKTHAGAKTLTPSFWEFMTYVHPRGDVMLAEKATSLAFAADVTAAEKQDYAMARAFFEKLPPLVDVAAYDDTALTISQLGGMNIIMFLYIALLGVFYIVMPLNSELVKLEMLNSTL